MQMICADALEGLRQIESGSVHTCVTSPPYYGLRDYGVDGQIGLEQTPGEYIARLVAVFREVKRALRDDGTLWVNIGDSYATGTKAGRQQSTNPGVGANNPEAQNSVARIGTPEGCKTKDLIGIPWMLAFALRADGWYLRQDIIWAKPNPMPESVTDRCTKSHEYIFLLSKSQKYYYDADAIKEPIAESTANDVRLYRDDYETGRPERGFVGQAQHGSGLLKPKASKKYSFARDSVESPPPGQMPQHRADREEIAYNLSRNKRDVWTVSTKPFTGAHFAVFPPDLILPCVLAGSPEGGTVLDPFTGSGTTGEVALENGREFVGCELNPTYAEMARNRIGKATQQIRLEIAP